jgi:hypothetical protein
LAYNESRIARVKYVSGYRRKSHSHDVVDPVEPTRPVTERLFAVLGLQKLSDEEYLQKLKKSRYVYMERIKKLERDIEQEQEQARQEEKTHGR